MFELVCQFDDLTFSWWMARPPKDDVQLALFLRGMKAPDAIPDEWGVFDLHGVRLWPASPAPPDEGI